MNWVVQLRGRLRPSFSERRARWAELGEDDALDNLPEPPGHLEPPFLSAERHRQYFPELFLLARDRQTGNGRVCSPRWVSRSVPILTPSKLPGIVSTTEVLIAPFVGSGADP